MSESEQTTDAETDVFAAELDDDVWVEDPSGPGIVARMLAEAAGTFILVLMGLAALMFSGGTNGTLPVGFAFAVGLVIALVVFGGISGAHVNPAVTIGMWVAGRFPGRDVVLYVLGQVVGGVAAGAVMMSLLSSLPQITNVASALGGVSNGYGDHSPLQMGLAGVVIVEVLIGAIFVAVFLAVTSLRTSTHALSGPLTLGLAFGFLVLATVPFTNGSLNPARATATALFAESWALQQLWVFWAAPIIGAAITGLLFRAFGPEEDLILLQQIETVETIEIIED